MEEFDPRRAAMELVTAFVDKHTLTAAELPALLTGVFNAIAAFGTQAPADADAKAEALEIASAPATAMPGTPASEDAKDEAALEAQMPPALSESPVPAVGVAESISDPDFIISLITGEKLKTLKRHLRTHGLTAAEYRERYGLPGDYPLVAPSYSQMRRSAAQKMGLGRRSDAGVPDSAEPGTTPSVPAERAAMAPASVKDRKTKPTRPRRALGKAAGTPPAARASSSGRKGRSGTAKSMSDAVDPAVGVEHTDTPSHAPNAPEQATDVPAAPEKPRRPRRTKLSAVFN